MKKLLISLTALLVLTVLLSGCTILTLEDAAKLSAGEYQGSSSYYDVEITPAAQPEVQTDALTGNSGEQTVPGEEGQDVSAAEPEITPEPEPTPEPTPEMPDWNMKTLGGGYFDDTVFFGDEVSAVLEYMDDNKHAIGGAITLIKDSYSLNGAVNWNTSDKFVFRYGGQSGGPDNILAGLPKVKKAYFMLGINDIPTVTVQEYTDLLTKLANNIWGKRSDVQLYFMSITPITAKAEKDQLTNANIDKFNEALRSFCAENGCYYIDVASHFKNENGALDPANAKADGRLLNLECGEKWAEIIKDPANYSMDPRK